MKKYTWIVALLVALSLVVVGCDTGGGTKKPEPTAADRIDVKFTQDMLDVWGGGAIVAEADGSGFTFTYGTGNNANHGNAVAMFKLDLGKAKVRDYEKVTFTFTGISGDLNPNTGEHDRGIEKGVNLLAAVNKDNMKNFGGNDGDLVTYIVNAYTGTAGGAAINAAGAKIGTDQPAAIALELAIAPARPQAKNTGEVWFSFYLHASAVKWDGTPLAATDEKTSFKITNVSFVPLKKPLGEVDGEDDGEDEEAAIPPPVFDDTTTPGSLIHTNPVFIQHGGWGKGIVIDPANKVTIPEGAQANFSYVYPTSGYTLADWDFVTLNLTTTGAIKNFGYKIYPSIDNDATAGAGGRTGALVDDDDSTIKLEIRKIPAGLGFQKYGGKTNDVDDAEIIIEIASAVFTKGTRHTVTLNPNGGTVTPTSTYLVETTAVADHLPVPTMANKTFVGWKKGSDWVLSSTTVDSGFASATLEAQWIDAKAIAPITVDLTTVASVGTGTLTGNTAAGYTYSANYENGFAKLTLDLGAGNVLANLDKVTFTVTGTGGDHGWKNAYLLAATTLSAGSNQHTAQSVGSYYINSAIDSENVTIVIDKAKAFALTGENLEISVYIHAPTSAVYTYSNIVFSQN